MDFPDSQNQFQLEHVQRMLSSFETLTGRLLAPFPTDAAGAREVFHAPFFLASHENSADPLLTYGNRTALALFEMTWQEFIGTPSRYTAEKPERSEREHLLSTVARQGYIDDYSGIRISRSGRRFEIRNATVWNLLDDQGNPVGQAATFSDWTHMPGQER